MATQPMVLKLKPVQTKKIVAAPSPVTFEPVSKRTSTKYDDNKIAERIPIEEVSHLTEQFAPEQFSFRTIPKHSAECNAIFQLKSGKYELPIWAEGLFDATPEGFRRKLKSLLEF